MNKLQITIIDLIKEIDAICRKHGITYYASGGTVIGAFRHGGFIPWDDDADLYMTRDNYHKFLKAFHMEKPKNRSYGTIEEDINYPGTITHYKDNKNTAFITRYHTLNACDAGIVVDIFILDPVSGDPQYWDEHIGKLKIYADLNFPFYAYCNCGNTEYMPKYLEYAKRVKKLGKATVNKELEQELFTYPEEKATHYILRWGTLPHVFEKEMFGEPVYVEYEGIDLPMPTKWYDYLVQLYGYNWNEIPSNISSEGHTAIISTEHRYTNYLIDADRFINKADALKMYYKRKNLIIEREILRRPFIEKYLYLKGNYVLLSQKKYLIKNHIDILELFKNKEYANIVESYQIYLDNQFNSYYIGKMSHNYFYRLKNPIFIPLPIDELEKLMFSLYYISDFNKLNKLLLMCEKNHIITPSTQQLKELLKSVHEILSLYYEKRYSDALQLFSATGKNFIFDCDRMTRIYFSCAIECQVKLEKEEIDYLLVKSSDNSNSEWVKVYGDYLNSIHDSGYMEYYKKCVESTNDGFILNQLKIRYDLEKDYHLCENDSHSCDEYHKKQLELLDEIVEVFDKNKIDYYLIGDTLISALFNHDLPTKYIPLDIAIKPGDARKVMSLFEENEKFSSPLDNEHIITCSFIYKALEQCCSILTSDGILEKQEVYVRINILRKNPQNILKRKFVNGLNLLYSALFSQNTKALYKCIAKIFFFIIPKNAIRNYTFNNYINMSLNNSSDKFRIHKKTYDVNCFDGTTKIKLYSNEYNAPIHLESILVDNYKRVLLKEKLYDESMFVLYDESCTIEEIQDIFKEFQNQPSIIRDYKKSLKISGKLKPYNKQSRYNWDILLRSEDRFNLYLEYKDKKEKILALYEEKNFEELWAELREYDKSVRIYLTKNLGLCFDKDILNIYLKVLEYRGENKTANKLERLVPEEHLAPIEFLDID